jgi:hypothetical protein
VTLVPLLLVLLAMLQPDVPPRAQVGPLQAWTARSATGVCQLRLRNTGDVPIEAWTVTVRSEEARHTTIAREDHWRDAYHLPLSAARVEPGETDAFTIADQAARGALTVRIVLLVRSDGVAYGTPEPVPGVGDADDERRGLVTRRTREAEEARQLADAIEARMASDGLVPMFEARRLSALLDAQGDLNWWRVRELVVGAEAAPAGDQGAASRVREAVGLLREAHRKGTADIVLQRAEPLRPMVVGRCG